MSGRSGAGPALAGGAVAVVPVAGVKRPAAGAAAGVHVAAGIGAELAVEPVRAAAAPARHDPSPLLIGAVDHGQMGWRPGFHRVPGGFLAWFTGHTGDAAGPGRAER